MKNRDIYLILLLLIATALVGSCSFVINFKVTGKIKNYDPQKHSDLKVQFDFYQSSQTQDSDYQHEVKSDGTFKIFGSFVNASPDGLSFISGDTTLARFHFHKERKKIVMKSLSSSEKFSAAKKDTIHFDNITIELVDETNKILAINFDDLFKGFHIEVQKEEMLIFFSQIPPNNTTINIHAEKGFKVIEENVPITSDTVLVDIDRFIKSSGKIQMDWIELVTPYDWSRLYSVYDNRYGSIFRN